jgi:Zn-dependent protease
VLPFGYVAILFIAVLIHECAHALTGRVVGQHPRHIVINVWGGYTQFKGGDVSPGRSVLVAFAGPASNLVLAGLGWLALTVADPQPGLGRSLLFMFTVANALLGGFNLIPGLPLDGGRILEAVLWGITGRRSTATTIAAWVGRAVALAVVLWAVWPLLLGHRPHPMSLVWMGLIAFVLWQAASQSLRGAKVRAQAESLDLRDLTTPVAVVGVGATLTQALNAVSTAAHLDPKAVVVIGPGGPVGVLEPAQVFAVERHLHDQVRVEQVATAQHPDDTLDIGVRADALIERLRALHGHRLVVTENGRVVGLADGHAVLSRLVRR